jgi:hypothetical protein
MSELSVGQLKGLTVNSNTITIPAGHKLYAPGSVVQVQKVRTEARTTYSSATSGNGTTVTDLNLTITPKFSNSLLMMQWMINGEFHHDNVFLIHKGGSLITTSGETGYNSIAGNSRWSGFMQSTYDTDQNSTPQNRFMQYFCNSGSTAEATFAPAVRSAGGTAYTFYLNRAQGSAGQDDYEVSVSTGVIWEIAQ